MEKVLLRDGEITLHTRERSNKWQMYINIKGTDVFVRKSTGTSNLDDAAQIATNYYDKLQSQIVQLELLDGLMKGFRY